MTDLDRLLEAMPRIADAVNTFTAPDAQRLAFNTLVDTVMRGGQASAPEQAHEAVPPILARGLDAFDRAGDIRIHSVHLADALGAGTTYDLARLLRPFGIEPLPNKFMRGGIELRGYDRASFEAAVAKYQ